MKVAVVLACTLACAFAIPEKRFFINDIVNGKFSNRFLSATFFSPVKEDSCLETWVQWSYPTANSG
jgi:hypothetical protein